MIVNMVRVDVVPNQQNNKNEQDTVVVVARAMVVTAVTVAVEVFSATNKLFV